jgi:N-acetylmuramoyl-L-alanine amidase
MNWSVFLRNIRLFAIAIFIVLGALNGLTEETTTSAFSDIKASDWYANTISTAVNAGLIKGFENGTFRPNDSITREQMASLISKALTITGKTVDVEGKVDQIISKFKAVFRIVVA